MSSPISHLGERQLSPRHPLTLFLVGTLGLWAATTVPSHAVPSYARQTGEERSACHRSTTVSRVTRTGPI
jgi:hypothetical protein